MAVLMQQVSNGLGLYRLGARAALRRGTRLARGLRPLLLVVRCEPLAARTRCSRAARAPFQRTMNTVQLGSLREQC